MKMQLTDCSKGNLEEQLYIQMHIEGDKIKKNNLSMHLQKLGQKMSMKLKRKKENCKYNRT